MGAHSASGDSLVPSPWPPRVTEMGKLISNLLEMLFLISQSLCLPSAMQESVTCWESPSATKNQGIRKIRSEWLLQPCSEPESITTGSARPCSGHSTRGHARLQGSLSPAFPGLSAKEILDLRDFPEVFLKKIGKDNSRDSSSSPAQQTHQLLHGIGGCFILVPGRANWLNIMKKCWIVGCKDRICKDASQAGY